MDLYTWWWMGSINYFIFVTVLQSIEKETGFITINMGRDKFPVHFTLRYMFSPVTTHHFLFACKYWYIFWIWITVEMENSAGGSITHTLHLKKRSNNSTTAKVRNDITANANDVNVNGSCFNMKSNSSTTMTSSSTSSEKRTASMGVFSLVPLEGACFARLSLEDVVRIARRHPLPSLLILSMLFFMGVEYTLQMVPPSCQPFDVGFILTGYIHGIISARPALNSVLAAFNTVRMFLSEKHHELAFINESDFVEST